MSISSAPIRPALSRAFAVAFTLVATVLLTGVCGGEAVSTSGFQLRDSAGLTLVRNGVEPVWTPEEAWWVEEVGRTRSEAGEAASELGYVVDAALAPDGRVFALDGQARAVRVFDDGGRYAGTVGGPGEGPGEFSDRVTSLEVVEGPTGPELWVLDGLRSTLHRFDLEGTPLASTSLSGDEATWSAWLERGRDDGLYLRLLEYRQDDSGAWVSRDRIQRVEAGASGTRPVALGDTVLVFDYLRDDTGKNSREFTLPTVVNAPAWAVLDDGTVAWTALLDSEVRLRRDRGNPVRVRGTGWISRPPSEADREVLRRLTVEMLRMTGSWKGDVSEVPLTFPPGLPVHTGLVAGPGGTVWVQRAGPLRNAHPMSMNTEDEPDGWGGSAWEVLDGDGRLLGTVELPPRVRVMAIRGDRIVGVHYDRDFVDRMVVLRIHRGGDTS